MRSESFLRHPDGSQPRVRHISATVAPSIQLGGRMRKVHSSNDFHDPRYNTKNVSELSTICARLRTMLIFAMF